MSADGCRKDIRRRGTMKADLAIARAVKNAERTRAVITTPDGLYVEVRGDRRFSHDLGLLLQDYYRRQAANDKSF